MVSSQVGVLRIIRECTGIAPKDAEFSRRQAKQSERASRQGKEVRDGASE